MNSLKITVFFVLMLMTFGAFAAYAGCAGCDGCDDATETTLKVFGESRYRLNTDGFDFNSDTPLNWFSEMRTRVSLKAKANDKTGAFFQVQDCRTIGINPGHNYTNQDIQMHQGYFWYKPCDKGWFKAGRFEVNMHNGRLISSVPWDNTGRTFEGMMFGRKLNDNVSLTGMALQVDERQDFYNDADGDPIADQMFYGVNVNLAEQNVDIFLYMKKNPSTTADDYSLMTFGVYSNRDFGSDMWYDAMFAMQTGTFTDGNDMSGMLLYAKVGKKFEKFGLSGGVDYTTGDDPTTTDKYECFDNLWMNYHRYYGAMDMGMLTNANGRDEGLMDLFLNGNYVVNEAWKIGGAYHMFSTVEDFVGTTETSIGSEIDVFAMYKADDFSWRSGYGMFSPSEDIFGSTADSQGWWYSAATVWW